MRWPKLVKKFTQSTPIEVSIEAEGVDEDGAPITAAQGSIMVNWQDKSRRVYGKDKMEVDVTASIYIDGDPFPSVAVITGGEVTAFGESRTIVQGEKGRNPDGTVNFTHLELR